MSVTRLSWLLLGGLLAGWLGALGTELPLREATLGLLAGWLVWLFEPHDEEDGGLAEEIDEADEPASLVAVPGEG